MKLKCLVIDDDPLVCDLVQHFCSKLESVEFCLAADSALNGLNLLVSQAMDVVFLDFNLPDMDGQSFLERKHLAVPVVMITSHTSFAADSYNYTDVLDFLVKPLSFDRFSRSVDRVLAYHQNNLPTGAVTGKSLFVKDGNKLIQLYFDQVNYIKSESNYVIFYLQEKQVMSLISLKELTTRLPANFIRIHRSFMVNIDKINYLTTEEVNIADTNLPIGLKYKADLMAKVTELK